VARIADDDNVEVSGWPSEEPELRERESCDRADSGAPVLAVPLPDADVVLLHLDAGPPEARDHLRVARVIALVGAEVEDAHQARGPATRSSGAPGLLPAESVSSPNARVCADFVSK
jgi:hypothetical protein